MSYTKYKYFNKQKGGIMIRENLYYHSLNVLIRAYFNNTLQAGSCSACAVGNLIANACGYKVVESNIKITPTKTKICLVWNNKNGKLIYPDWNRVFSTRLIFGIFPVQKYMFANYKIFQKEIDSAGYTLKELMKIEFAFEKGYKKLFCSDRMFSGLCAVVKVLDEIHENKDNEITRTVYRHLYDKKELISV